MKKNVWLYFNTEVDDDDVADSTNGMFLADNLIGMVPQADGTLQLQFKSMRNVTSAATDTVLLTLGANNTHLDVMKAITRAINNTRPTFGGFICVADDRTVIVGGAAGSATAEYLTDTNRQDDGYISACGTIDISSSTLSQLTATSGGTGSAIVPGSGFYTISSTNDDHIITLPAPVIGTKVYLNSAGETGQNYELRTSDPSTVKLNNVSGSGKEALIEEAVSLVVATCLSTTEWLVTQYTNVGDIDHVPVAD